MQNLEAFIARADELIDFLIRHVKNKIKNRSYYNGDNKQRSVGCAISRSDH